MKMTANLTIYAFKKSFKTVNITEYNISLCNALIHCYYLLLTNQNRRAHQNTTTTSAIENPLSACERAHSHL